MTTNSSTEARSATVSIAELAGCSGLELVAGLADGSIRRPPMADTFPFAIAELYHLSGGDRNEDRTSPGISID